MIYLKESFNIHPATPATRDRFVAAVEEALVPANADHGARLVGAWFAHEEWFTQIIHVTEFNDGAALERYRAATTRDGNLGGSHAKLASLAPERPSEVLEPLGPVPASTLHAAIEASQEKPAGIYTFAILEVNEGAMDAFTALLGGAAALLPIAAAWKSVDGNPNQIIDLWKGDTGRAGFSPSDERQDAFFEPLRKIAPRERMMRLHVMPYSPLR